MLKKLAISAVVYTLLAIASPSARAESTLDFKIVNKTGYGIKALYIAPTSEDEWGENLLSEVLENGESVDIEFEPKADSIAKWDIMVDWIDEDDAVYWRGLKLAEISKVTLRYDREKGETSANVE